jgi:hypothetical protein
MWDKTKSNNGGNRLLYLENSSALYNRPRVCKMVAFLAKLDQREKLMSNHIADLSRSVLRYDDVSDRGRITCTHFEEITGRSLKDDL